jgi:hypothetical protein
MNRNWSIVLALAVAVFLAIVLLKPNERSGGAPRVTATTVITPATPANSSAAKWPIGDRNAGFRVDENGG